MRMFWTPVARLSDNLEGSVLQEQTKLGQGCCHKRKERFILALFSLYNVGKGLFIKQGVRNTDFGVDYIAIKRNGKVQATLGRCAKRAYAIQPSELLFRHQESRL